jgi:hypothetical protein
VRIRVGNLTMTNHPIHLHGHEFEVTGTDGGWVRPSARWPEVTTDIAVGQMRAIEFVADEPGDWAFHCHKSHHTMNAMGHDVPTMIGVDHSGVAQKINNLVPDYMVMGDKGGRWAAWRCRFRKTPADDDGRGPFGSLDMGGMFTVVKVREGLARNDYKDPGWYQHPKAQWRVNGRANCRPRHAPRRAAIQACRGNGCEARRRHASPSLTKEVARDLISPADLLVCKAL